jgi:hypothetical protein
VTLEAVPSSFSIARFSATSNAGERSSSRESGVTKKTQRQRSGRRSKAVAERFIPFTPFHGNDVNEIPFERYARFSGCAR